MVRAVHTALFLVIFTCVYGQDLLITADSFVKEFTVQGSDERDDIIHSLFRHNLGGERTFIWERTEEYLSNGWETAICDINRCHSTIVSTESFILGSGIDGTLDVHHYNNGLTGDSSVVFVKIYEEGIPDVFISQKYVFKNVRGTVSNNDLEHLEALQIFPNPTSEYFKLENENFYVKNLHIYNITGKLVARFDTKDLNEYDVSFLPKGAYFVKLNGENKTLKTLRLNII